MTNTKVVALVSDLMFAVKIGDAAKRVGLQVEYAKTDAEFLAKMQSLPVLAIMDLNIGTASPVDLIQRMKGDSGLKDISIMGFVSHVQTELRQAAQDAGADVVLARSAFSNNLPEILRRHTGVNGGEPVA